MDAEKRARYEGMMSQVREDVEKIDQEMEDLLAQIKTKLAGLQQEKEAQLVIYDGYCRLLGVENDLAEDEAADE